MQRNSSQRKLLALGLRNYRSLRRRPKRNAFVASSVFVCLVLLLGFQNCEFKPQGNGVASSSRSSSGPGGAAVGGTGPDAALTARLENGRPFFKDSGNGSNNPAGWSAQYFNPNNIALSIKVGLGPEGGSKNTLIPAANTFNAATWRGLRVYGHAGMSTRGVREVDALLEFTEHETAAVQSGPVGFVALASPDLNSQSSGSGIIPFGFFAKDTAFCPASNESVEFKLRLKDANSSATGISNAVYLTGFSHVGGKQSRTTEDYGNSPSITVAFQNTCPRESEVGYPWNVVDDSTSANHRLEQDDKFGSSVTVNGETLVVTAEGDSGPNNSIATSGAAYVYRRQNNNWVFQRKINGAAAQDRTNTAAIGDGGEIALGAPARRAVGTLGQTVSGRGGVNFFTQSNGADGRWSYTLAGTVAPNPANQFGGDYFGTSLTFRGPYLFVGAPGDSTQATQQGAVYVFSRTTRAPVQKLIPRDAAQTPLREGSGAGHALAATTLSNGNILLAVGAPLNQSYNDAPGAVIVFECTPSGATPCTQREYITATGASRIGSSVAIEASPNGAVHLVVGAAGGNGNAFYFLRSPNSPTFLKQTFGFTNAQAVGQTDLKRPVNANRSGYGSSVSLAYPFVAIGAPQHNFTVQGQSNLTNGGVVYIVKLDRGGTTPADGDFFQLRPRAVAANGLFGWSVALRPQGGTPELIAGARHYPARNALGNGTITTSGTVFSIDVPALMNGDL